MNKTMNGVIMNKYLSNDTGSGILELAIDINYNNGCKILYHNSDNCKWMSLQAHKHGYSTYLFNEV